MAYSDSDYTTRQTMKEILLTKKRKMYLDMIFDNGDGAQPGKFTGELIINMNVDKELDEYMDKVTKEKSNGASS